MLLAVIRLLLHNEPDVHLSSPQHALHRTRTTRRVQKDVQATRAYWPLLLSLSAVAVTRVLKLICVKRY
jgi:hypothetical protein